MIVLAFKVVQPDNQVMVRLSPLEDWVPYTESVRDKLAEKVYYDSRVYMYCEQDFKDLLLSKIKYENCPDFVTSDDITDDALATFGIRHENNRPLLFSDNKIEAFKRTLNECVRCGGREMPLSLLDWICKGMQNIYAAQSLVHRERNAAIPDVEKIIKASFEKDYTRLNKYDFSNCKNFAHIINDTLVGSAKYAWELYDEYAGTSDLDDELVKAWTKQYLNIDWLDIEFTKHTVGC